MYIHKLLAARILQFQFPVLSFTHEFRPDQYWQPAGCRRSVTTLQEGFPHDASYLPEASSPLRPRFPGYQSSISWKEIGRWGRPTLASWLWWQIENRRGLGGAAFRPAVDHTDQQVRTRPTSHDITLPNHCQSCCLDLFEILLKLVGMQLPPLLD